MKWLRFLVVMLAVAGYVEASRWLGLSLLYATDAPVEFDRQRPPTVEVAPAPPRPLRPGDLPDISLAPAPRPRAMASAPASRPRGGLEAAVEASGLANKLPPDLQPSAGGPAGQSDRALFHRTRVIHSWSSRWRRWYRHPGRPVPALSRAARGLRPESLPVA